MITTFQKVLQLIQGPHRKETKGGWKIPCVMLQRGEVGVTPKESLVPPAPEPGKRWVIFQDLKEAASLRAARIPGCLSALLGLEGRWGAEGGLTLPRALRRITEAHLNLLPQHFDHL